MIGELSLYKGRPKGCQVKGSGLGRSCARATPVPIEQSFDPSEPGLCGPQRETANLRDPDSSCMNRPECQLQGGNVYSVNVQGWNDEEPTAHTRHVSRLN